MLLLDSIGTIEVDYDNVNDKKQRLFDEYFKAVQPQVSGDKVLVNISDIVKDLRKKGYWTFDFIRSNEKIDVEEGSKKIQLV